MIEKLTEFKTWLDDYPVDELEILEMNFDNDDPDFGVESVPPDVRRKAQLSSIIKVAQQMKKFDIAEAAKEKDADPIQLYGLLKMADKIKSLPFRKVNNSSEVLLQA
jgi:hypothetical protein